MRAAVAGLILAVIVALGLIASRSRSGELAPVTSVAFEAELPIPAAQTTALSGGDRVAPVRVASADGVAEKVAPAVGADQGFVRVHSAEGLPLCHVEWRGDGPVAWTLADAPRVPRAARSVRALGHAETELPPKLDEVTLAVDTLLRLDARGLEPHELTEALLELEVTLWPPFDNDAPERGALFAVTDRGALALAATPLRTAPDRRAFEVRATASFVSGAHLQVTWMPTTGTHTELRIDLEPRDVLATLAPLVLRERGAPEAPDALRMVALMKRSRSDAPLDPRKWETADARVFLLTHWHTWRLDVQGPPVVPDLPTQAEYVLALSRADGWYARTTLLHDGTPRDVELSPPARLVAHIVDEEGRGVAGANVRIEFDGVTGLSEEAVVWNCTPTTSGHDGQVELVAPTRVHPIDPEELESMPHVCRVSIAAQSYAPLSVDVPLHPGVTRDLGPLVLRARQPDIVVEFPGDVSELSGAHWELEGVVQYQVIVRTRARDANTLEAEFETHGVEPPKVERLVLYDTDGGAVTARRAGDRYVVEESRALRCTLDTSALDPPPYYLQVGARWGAVTWHVTGSSRSNVLAAEHSIDQVVPAEGVELFWREMDDEQQFGPAHPLPWPTPGETLRLAR